MTHFDYLELRENYRVVLAERNTLLTDNDRLRAEITELREAAQAHCAVRIARPAEGEQAEFHKLLDSRMRLRAVLTKSSAVVHNTEGTGTGTQR